LRLRAVGKRVAAIFGTLGLVGATSAVFAQEGGWFASVQEARDYLSQNPVGARAEQAFRAIVDADLAARYPEFDRKAIAGGFAVSVVPGSGLSRAQADAAFAEAERSLSMELSEAAARLRVEGSRENSSRGGGGAGGGSGGGSQNGSGRY
jgi:uncharacterized membrane protein YgcG